VWVCACVMGVMWLGAGCLYECYAGTVTVYISEVRKGRRRVAFCWGFSSCVYVYIKALWLSVCVV